MVKRVAVAMPPLDMRMFHRFTRFVRRFCHTHLQSLTFDALEDFSFDEWIEAAPYPLYRKNELREVHKQSLFRAPITLVKAFTKSEWYSEFKHFRGIYARHDDFKVRLGPFAKKFGDLLFKLKWFIKKIPVNSRPAALLEKLSHYEHIFCTDFSQYEATFVKRLMKVEIWVYMWALRNNSARSALGDLFDYLHGTNKIDFKHFSATLTAKRMSGEMLTSCGNGLMNMLFTFFHLEEAGNDLSLIDAFFEGDDGIVGCMILPQAIQYEALGANIKIEIPRGINTASFCGNVFDPIALHNVRNPLEYAVTFAWVDAKYLQASEAVKLKLLRVKSMSLISEYPGCPVLKSLAMYGIRVTRKVKVTDEFIERNYGDDSYNYEKIKNIFANFDERNLQDVQIHINSRNLVETMYGLTVHQQLDIEQYLDSKTDISPLECFSSISGCKDWMIFYRDYVVDYVSKHDRFIFTKTGYSTDFYTDDQTMMSVNH